MGRLFDWRGKEPKQPLLPAPVVDAHCEEVPPPPPDDAEEQVTIRMPAGRAFELRYILPLVAEGLKPAPDGNGTVEMVEAAIADIDRALPPELAALIDERQIAEFRMDAIDAQRKAGLRR